jgi:tetratricopeptide (TPR) repeat protein
MKTMARRLHRCLIVLSTLVLLTGTTFSDDASRVKALVITNSAIELTDASRAVAMLWQATDIDPTSTEPYIYLGLYYNLHKDYDKLIEVYTKFVKYRPNEPNAYLHLGEAYMSFDPPRPEEALPYFRKAYELDPHSSLAALRLGEILAHERHRDQAVRYLKQAAADHSNSDFAAEAKDVLRDLGRF